MSRRWRDGRGSASVELAILAPLVGLLLGALVLVGRVQLARADVEGAARSAARDLSIARDPYLAADMVRAGLMTTLDVGSPTCRTLSFMPDIGSARVAVTLTCTVDLSEAAVLPVPGSMSVSATAAEVIDTYREGP
ncbi:MAG: TadE/TadG family type IV pilus assembly protein [Microbacteriaceae bacterium]